MNTLQLLPGDKLYASCAGEVYADILEVFDRHCTLLVHKASDLIDSDLDGGDGPTDEDEREWPGWNDWRRRHLTRLAEETPIKLQEVFFARNEASPREPSDERMSQFATGEDGWLIVGTVAFNTPPRSACYRCTKLFAVLRKSPLTTDAPSYPSLSASPRPVQT